MDLPLEIRVHDENGDSCLDSDDDLVGCEVHGQLKLYHKMLRQLHTEVRDQEEALFKLSEMINEDKMFNVRNQL